LLPFHAKFGRKGRSWSRTRICKSWNSHLPIYNNIIAWRRSAALLFPQGERKGLLSSLE
jgi:hypothetical protein